MMACARAAESEKPRVRSVAQTSVVMTLLVARPLPLIDLFNSPIMVPNANLACLAHSMFLAAKCVHRWWLDVAFSRVACDECCDIEGDRRLRVESTPLHRDVVGVMDKYKSSWHCVFEIELGGTPSDYGV